MNSKLQVLVLGAGGYLGTRLVEALARSSWAQPVAGLRRNAPLPAMVPRVILDATQPSDLIEAMSQVDMVVNCVAADARGIIANAEALAEATARLPHLKRVVHLSSMAAYGDVHGRIDEGVAPALDLGPYSAAKQHAEQCLAGQSRIVMLRPGCIFGPGSPQWSTRIARWIESGRIGDLGAAGDGCSNAVYVGDVVEAIQRVLREPGPQPSAFNLASPELWSWNRYFTVYALALQPVAAPSIATGRLWREAYLWAAPLKLAERMAGGPRSWLPEPIPPSLLRLWAGDLRLDSSRATQGLGLEWTPMWAALARTGHWYRCERHRRASLDARLNSAS